LKNVVGHMRYFVYKKLDSPFGGNVYNWQTTQQTKDRAFNAFRDIVEKGHGIIHSDILASEMKIIVRERDGFLGASGRGKDDCTVASAIAAECYVRYFYVKLNQMGVTWGKERLRREKMKEVGRDMTAVENSVVRSVGGFMKSIGVPFGEEHG